MATGEPARPRAGGAGPYIGRVLLIYESRIILETVRAVPSDAGVHIEAVDDEDEGLRRATEESFDAVVVCAVTRRTSGYALAKRIRERTGERYLPILILVVRAGEDERAHAERAGADGLLDLAGSPEEMRFRIEPFLRAGRRLREIAGDLELAEERTRALARANAEAGHFLMEVEERDRRIQEQSRELEARAKSLARANAEAARLILEIEEKDRRLQAQSREIERHMEVLRRDLAIAADLQINLLPNEYPDAPGVRLFDRFLPAAELCGDYFDYILRENGDFDAVVADVTGHGVASALVSVQVRAMARAQTHGHRSPSEILARLNEFMITSFNRQFFMTMFYLGYRAATGRIEYAGAGHNPALLLRRNEAAPESLRSQSVPLGIVAGARFPESTLELAPGDRLLLYTDGLTEICNGRSEPFGAGRVEQFLASSREVGGRNVLDGLLREARYFAGRANFDDDVTLVLMERETS